MRCSRIQAANVLPLLLTALAAVGAVNAGNDNIASRSLIKPSILNDPTLHPTSEIEARLFRSTEASAATERIRARTWTRVKTAK